MIALAVAFCSAWTADLLTSFLLPPGAELNPLRAAADPFEAVVLKAGSALLVLALVAIIARRRPTLAGLVLVLGVAGGWLGAVSNVVAA